MVDNTHSDGSFVKSHVQSERRHLFALLLFLVVSTLFVPVHFVLPSDFGTINLFLDLFLLRHTKFYGVHVYFSTMEM